jgi:hypothetical protein
MRSVLLMAHHLQMALPMVVATPTELHARDDDDSSLQQPQKRQARATHTKISSFRFWI